MFLKRLKCWITVYMKVLSWLLPGRGRISSSSRHCENSSTSMKMDAMWVRMVGHRDYRNPYLANSLAVRVSAKEITSLILDEERLRAERNDRKSWKSRVTGIEEFGSASNEDAPPPRRPRERPHRAQRADEEDAEY